MKTLLCAINSKYIHSNPAVYALRAYASEYRQDIKIHEYTINQNIQDILSDIYEEAPDLLAFSCYIWNISYVHTLLYDLSKILPDLPVLLGGPEVSYDPEKMLTLHDNVKTVIIGEGEATFKEVLQAYHTKGPDPILKDITGLCLRKEDSGFLYTGIRHPLSMDELPFFYDEFSDDPDVGPFKNKIIYYETSRGCPFSCSYCLSSIDKKIRLKSVDLVFRELDFFLSHQVSQVKFLDRTFNCNEKHALAIWTYLLEHDNGKTNFHFEISADILTEQELLILSKMRPGLVQLEIGVQSTNPETIREIKRTMDLQKLQKAVEKIHSFRNIHVHLDLIAGLPYEDYESFIKSFNDIYAMQPDELQLGFLKVLKGTFMAQEIKSYELYHTEEPPYEVLKTKWLSYKDVIHLKKIEAMTELYYNSRQYTKTLSVVLSSYESAYSFYDRLAQYYEEHGYFKNQPSRDYRSSVLLSFLKETSGLPERLLSELLTYDLYLRENLKRRPAFSEDPAHHKARIMALLKTHSVDKNDHLELFSYPVFSNDPDLIRHSTIGEYAVVFRYSSLNPLDHNAAVTVL